MSLYSSLKPTLMILCSGITFALISCKTRFVEKTKTKEFVNSNMTGRNFDLQPKEFVLTFDDGPGASTQTLVDYLVLNKIPAVFFMVGNQMNQFPGVVRSIASHPELFVVANHSMNHSKPLTDSTAWAIDEISKADKILSTFWTGTKYMRPPYGALVGSTARIQGINAASPNLANYIGPVFWNVGGELTNTHSADFACWGKLLTAN